MPEKHQRILIVDDEEIVLVALRETLRRTLPNLEITSTGEPLEALRLIQEDAFDLIITDHQMPHILGIDLLKKAKERSPQTVGILITAVLSLAVVIDAINKAEVYRFVVKPWLREELLATIQNALALAALRARQNAILAAAEGRIRELATENSQPSLEAQGPSHHTLNRHGSPSPLRAPSPNHLYPFLVGGLLHNVLNTLVGLHHASDTLASLAQEFGDQGKQLHQPLGALNTSLSNLEVLLRLIHTMSRDYYSSSPEEAVLPDVAPVIQEVSASWPDVSVRCNVDPEFATLHVPPGISAFLIGELARNACRASRGRPNAAVELDVRVNPADSTVSFTCSDQGTGFTPEQLSRINTQAIRAPKSQGVGGYGLFLMQQIAMRLNGWLTASNLEPCGAKVDLVIYYRL